MVRAGVFIGVDKAGNLQKLKDAASGAGRMHRWALEQGMTDKTYAKLITDKDGTNIHPHTIYEKIKQILEGPGPRVEQLIIYFAGHGVNINHSEQWLLTDAPVDTSAAVDVLSSVELARYCGVDHVVVISDACRVAPEGIQAQRVRGIDIFPNESMSDRAKPVDQFFACLLGKTATELKDPVAAARGFSALYTTVLLEGLNGFDDGILDAAETAEDTACYVKPVKLEAYLERAVAFRVKRMNLENRVNQNPDAIITSHSNWISRVTVRPRAVRAAVPQPAPDLRSVTRGLVRSAVARSPSGVADEISRMRVNQIPGSAQLAETAERVAESFGADRIDTNCGIKVRGAGILRVLMASGPVRLPESEGDLVRLEIVDKPASVTIRFQGNFGTVIPAFPGYLAALTLDGPSLVDIAFEPAANTPLWDEYVSRAAETRKLRGVAASASQHSRLRLDLNEALTMAKQTIANNGIDPALALYAAYACHDLEQTEQIRQMTDCLRNSLGGFAFFDLVLLSRMMIKKKVDRAVNFFPFVPLFSQGWRLLRAHRVQLHPALKDIDRTMRESVWSLFEGAGVDMLENAILSREVC